MQLAVPFEYQNDAGGTVLARAYEDAELVSSRQLTCFSDFRHPSSKNPPAASEYVEYLRNYCSHFNLWPHIKLSTRVVSETQSLEGKRMLAAVVCDAVAICTGVPACTWSRMSRTPASSVTRRRPYIRLA
ncbi:hypothetical protein BB8028_0012g00180 [Beauveria bassiana]|uniref:Uncharacterized protein n=1 Tax=Beauveria bassiana TaxID=176275 RepID=A0A2S7YPK4_BEABA|nr:hypothetical protein BB8028_0012g00180 [Beauveria bassiana]